MAPSYDIIIVGAGVIGLTQAVCFTACGFKVAIVDKQAEPSTILTENFDSRVFALNRFSQNCLQQWGIWSAIESLRAVDYQQVALMFQGSEPDLIFHAADDAEPNLGYIVEQAVWRQAVLEKLKNDTQCDFFWQHTLTCFEQQDDTLLYVTLAEENNAKKTLRCQTNLLVGADGADSQVRIQSGIQSDLYPCQQTAIVLTLQTTKSHQYTAAQYFCSHGIIAFLPLANPHYFSIVWSMPCAQLEMLALTDESLIHLLNHITDQKWGLLSLTAKPIYFPLNQMQALSYFSAQTVLIGDAAHTIHPLAGQGANLGIADIHALTEHISWSKAHGRSASDYTSLKKYSRSRRSAAFKMMGLMDIFALGSGQFPWLNQLVAKGCRTINHVAFLKNILSRFALYQFTK